MKYKIVPLNLRQKDKRGKVFDFFLKDKKHFLFFFTKKGKLRAAHYHLGKSKSKNPENLFLVSGKIKFFFKDMKTGKEEIVIVSDPSWIRIWPKVYHELHALTDYILFEPNNEDFVAKDVIWPYDKNGKGKNKK